MNKIVNLKLKLGVLKWDLLNFLSLSSLLLSALTFLPIHQHSTLKQLHLLSEILIPLFPTQVSEMLSTFGLFQLPTLLNMIDGVCSEEKIKFEGRE